MSTNIPTTSRTYRVVGMTCGHCVAAVQREVGAIDGVTDVAVDLPTGDVVITSTHPIDHAAISAAIDEAGYELAS
ncbi:copper ion binding protein [Nocardioides terrae]|uniref:Copper ion binding protein n=1 Tax=Nocardioides terrae TaxID=574651 RepID=A0A1I1N7N2_9ACTN|nr:heavy metal-associated domain-containing protein [Nocardioides terrae]SFC93724.1 copper ion binding protein [Nocardioides terrae]